MKSRTLPRLRIFISDPPGGAHLYGAWTLYRMLSQPLWPLYHASAAGLPFSCHRYFLSHQRLSRRRREEGLWAGRQAEGLDYRLAEPVSPPGCVEGRGLGRMLGGMAFPFHSTIYKPRKPSEKRKPIPVLSSEGGGAELRGGLAGLGWCARRRRDGGHGRQPEGRKRKRLQLARPLRKTAERGKTGSVTCVIKRLEHGRVVGVAAHVFLLMDGTTWFVRTHLLRAFCLFSCARRAISRFCCLQGCSKLRNISCPLDHRKGYRKTSQSRAAGGRRRRNRKRRKTAASGTSEENWKELCSLRHLRKNFHSSYRTGAGRKQRGRPEDAELPALQGATGPSGISAESATGT